MKDAIHALAKRYACYLQRQRETARFTFSIFCISFLLSLLYLSTYFLSSKDAYDLVLGIITLAIARQKFEKMGFDQMAKEKT
jgi:hypothetical protein